MHSPSPFTVALLIPTGVGAAQGGYGGDASVWMQLLASCCDTLVTHPNVANAAAFQHVPQNALYVEGYGLDKWLAGEWALRPVRKQRVGVLLDAGIEPGMQTLQRNTVNAVKTVYGVDITGEEVTTEPLQLQISTQQSGASSGALSNPDVLLKGAEKLFAESATAVAIASRIEEPEDSTYSQGIGPDPIGGLEAIVSHTLVQQFEKPCANAPVFDWKEAQPRRDELVDPRTASEYITATFLPCVLQGLSKAPNFIPVANANPAQDVLPEHLDAIVIPMGCAGGPGVLAALGRKIPIIEVASNTTVQRVSLEALIGTDRYTALQKQHLAFTASTYYEAAGLLQALRLGLTPA